MEKYLFSVAVLLVTLLLGGRVMATGTAASTQSTATTTSTMTTKPATTAAATTTASAPAAVAAPAAPATLPGGLQMHDDKVGTGPEAKTGMMVSVHYTGKLTTGKKFDSSLDRGKPFEFPLGAGRVIKGWDLGVAGMKVGGKRTLTIPSDLAYGDQGVPGTIPPKSTLVFDVELLGVK